MRHRRSLVIGLVILVFALGVVVTRSRIKTPRGFTPSNLEVKAIHGTVARAAMSTSPSQLVCAVTTCLAITYGDHDASELWVRRNTQRGFSPVSPLAGQDQLIEGIACANAESCLVIAGQGPAAVNPQPFVTTNAGQSWAATAIAVGMRPASVGCLPGGPCWVTGEINSQPVAFVSKDPTLATWSHLRLPAEPANGNNQISCATVSTCVDVVGIPYAMNSGEEILYGGLTQGLEGVLQPTQVGPDDKAGCDESACYAINAFESQDEKKIVVSEIQPSGDINTVQMVTRPWTFVDQLTCNLTSCVIETEVNGTVDNFYTLGSHLSLLTTPRDLYLDSPGLQCVRTSPTCLLQVGVTGFGTSYQMTLHNGDFKLGKALSFPVGQTSTSLARNVPLASCVAGSCYELRDSAGQLVLLTLNPERDHVLRIASIRTNTIGITLLQPVAMACPTAGLCQVIVEEGNGPYQVLSVDPQTDHVVVRSLPGAVSPESLACASNTTCVMAVSGISHHHSFPVLWSDNAGLTWHPSRALNALNDLSTDAVACSANDTCLAIGQHDFVDGYGTLRPFVARSTDGGATWRLVKLSGPVPYSLPGPGIGTVACLTDTNCVGVLATGPSTVVLAGNARSGAWRIRTLHLHPVSKNPSPEDASIACGSTQCVVTLTINPETATGDSTPVYSVQSLIVTSGFRIGHVIMGKLLVNGILAPSSASHKYLETNAYGAVWVSAVANGHA